MPEPWIAVLLFAAFLVTSWVYVARARHPGQKPLAAYLIFVVAFSVTVGLVYGLLVSVIARLGVVGNLSLVLVVVVAAVLAFLIARSLVRRPPRSSPPL